MRRTRELSTPNITSENRNAINIELDSCSQSELPHWVFLGSIKFLASFALTATAAAGYYVYDKVKEQKAKENYAECRNLMSAHDNDSAETIRIKKRAILRRLVYGTYDRFRGAENYDEWWTNVHYRLVPLESLLSVDERNSYAEGACCIGLTWSISAWTPSEFDLAWRRSQYDLGQARSITSCSALKTQIQSSNLNSNFEFEPNEFEN